MFTSFNGTQILLSIMILLLGVTLVIIGIQLFFVLKDLRKNLDKTSRILDDVEQISARAVEEQRNIDDILGGLRMMVGSMTEATSSVSQMTNKLVGPAGVSMAMFQAVSTLIHKHKQREAEHGGNGRSY